MSVLNTVIQDPIATWEDYQRAAKEGIAAALGLHAGGKVLEKAVGKVVDKGLDKLGEKAVEKLDKFLGEPLGKGLTVAGEGAHPTVQWQPNPNGLVRNKTEIRELVRKQGVDIPDYVDIEVLPDLMFRDNVYANYTGNFACNDRVSIGWDSLFRTSNGRKAMRVTIRESLLNSDQGIAGILAHEIHEIRRLEEFFRLRGNKPISSKMLNDLVGPNGTYHLEAWTACDKIVKKMQGEQQP